MGIDGSGSNRNIPLRYSEAESSVGLMLVYHTHWQRSDTGAMATVQNSGPHTCSDK